MVLPTTWKHLVPTCPRWKEAQRPIRDRMVCLNIRSDVDSPQPPAVRMARSSSVPPKATDNNARNSRTDVKTPSVSRSQSLNNVPHRLSLIAETSSEPTRPNNEIRNTDGSQDRKHRGELEDDQKTIMPMPQTLIVKSLRVSKKLPSPGQLHKVLKHSKEDATKPDIPDTSLTHAELAEHLGLAGDRPALAPRQDENWPLCSGTYQPGTNIFQSEPLATHDTKETASPIWSSEPPVTIHVSIPGDYSFAPNLCFPIVPEHPMRRHPMLVAFDQIRNEYTEVLREHQLTYPWAGGPYHLPPSDTNVFEPDCPLAVFVVWISEEEAISLRPKVRNNQARVDKLKSIREDLKRLLNRIGMLVPIRFYVYQPRPNSSSSMPIC